MSEVQLNPERAEARRLWRKRISDMIAGNALSTMSVAHKGEPGHEEDEVS